MTASTKTYERKRVETWRAIHDAAATLALQNGVAHATIDVIASTAGVSRRTFFNYFQTKEDAILGLELPEITEEALAQFQAEEGDVLRSLVQLVATVALSATRLAPDSVFRRSLILRFPEIRIRIQHQSGLSEALIAPVLHEKLGIDPALDDDSVKAMQMLAGTITRFAFAKKSNPSNLTSADIDSAVELFRNISKDNRCQ